MISQSQVDYFKEVGIWYTGVPAMDSTVHLSSLRSFLNREEDYKAKFLQTKFNQGFEGYSFMGQEDSANQYADDQLFTCVISDYVDQSVHAAEFAALFQAQEKLIPQIASLEVELLSGLSEDLLSFYHQNIAHSLSANFYPAGGSSSLRLTAHPDGSLLTVFPFGMDKEFQFELPDGSWQTVEKTGEIAIFSGYLMECMTDIKSLNHKVEKQGAHEERFSFAYFSIPSPGCSFQTNQGQMTTESYFKRYLSLFE